MFGNPFQEVAHGDHNIIQLADSACPQPPPRGQQFCHVTDCPPSWQTSPWTKVTHSVIFSVLTMHIGNPGRHPLVVRFIRISHAS